jgi:predicted MPP superfamily phosphohydrolase
MHEVVAHSPPPPRVERVRKGRWLQLPPPTGFGWTRMHLPIASLSGPLVGLRILHLADIHLRRRWFAAYDQIIDLVAANPPDLILFTGDLVEHRRLREHEIRLGRRFVDSLPSRLGIYGIFGNHDGDHLSHQLASQRFCAIENALVTLPSQDGDIELIGLPGVHRDDLDEEFLNRLPPRRAGVRIVLAHYPDQISRIQRLNADIMLAGHTHGGQICLPGGHAIFNHDSLPRRFASGAHRRGNMWLVVSRGIGYAGLPVRAFCPSEVVEIVLKRDRV